MKILIVDDNSDDRTLLRHIVERYGHEPVEARNGKEALDMTRTHLPELIVSDALMPVMDGFSLLRRLKEDEELRSIPFIFYSATYQADEDVALAECLGACAYLFKPMSPEQLWAKIEEIHCSCTHDKPVSPMVPKEHQVEILERYSTVVATKLEEKVSELEQAILRQKEAEKELRAQKDFLQKSLDSLTHPFYVINVKDYRIALANTASHAEKYQEGVTCYYMTHSRNSPCSGGDHPCTIEEILKSKAPVVLKHIHYNEVGAQRVVEVHGYPVFGKDAEIVQVIEYCIDVTDREKLKEQLQQAQKMEAIGTLAGGIAHDFNNILSAILGYSELILEKLPEGGMLRMQQEQVLQAGMRAKELVRQILIFSRQSHQNRMPIHCHHIVKEAIKLLRSSIPTTIEFKQHVDTDTGLVLADPTQLHQILMNLGTNAYHAMRETGGILTINLSASQTEKDQFISVSEILPAGSYVKIEVSDTGCGIERQVVDKIFDPYFTTKNKGEGTGLGLAMVLGIVKSYEGHIFVDTKLGQGSTFQVYLPRIADQNEVPVEEIQKRHGGTERILVVDDEESLAKLLESMLSSLGYQVRYFTGSEELLKTFQSSPEAFDLIITDMTMPDMTGVELSKKLMALRQDIPVIICTGYSEAIDPEKAKSIGIKEYLRKPFTKSVLAQAVRKVLDG